MSLGQRGIIGLALLAIAMWPAALRGQVNRGELRLRVLDPIGQALSGAEGTLASEAPALARSFVADAEGQATLADLPFGVYRLSVGLPGFVTRTQVVDVHSATPIALQVTLDVGLVVTEQVTEPLVDA